MSFGLLKTLFFTSSAALLIALSTGSSPLFAQNKSSACTPTPEVKQALDKLNRRYYWALTNSQAREKKRDYFSTLLERFPGDLFVESAYQDFLREDQTADLSPLTERYQKLAEQHDRDAMYLYLYARALYGTRTKEAVSYFEKTLALDPNFCRAHLGLARIYEAKTFEDEAKAVTNLQAFMDGCPSSLEPLDHLRPIREQAFLRSCVTKMRTLIAGRTDDEALGYYPKLWEAEFRATPVEDHDRLRESIGADLKQIKAAGNDDDINVFLALKEGYKLTANQQDTKWAEDQLISRFPQSNEAGMIEHDRWAAGHPPPIPPSPGQPRLTLEQWAPYNAEKRKEAERRIAVAPYDLRAWADKVSAIEIDRNASPSEIEAAADGFLRAEDESSVGDLMVFPPPELQLAESYWQRGIRIDQIPALVERSFKSAAAFVDRNKGSDLVPPRSGPPNNLLDFVHWQGWTLLTESYTKLKQYDNAHQVLAIEEKWLDDNNGKASPGDPAYLVHQWLYWGSKADLAEAEGHKLDALAYSLRLSPLAPAPGGKTAAPYVDDRARRLWKELGGSDEGLQAWLSQAQVSRTIVAPKITVVPSGSVLPESKLTNKPLPDFELTDLKGKKWRLNDLKGKVAFVNVWATWCGPCRLELPYVEKLYEKVKDRPDIVVLTFNVDENPGLVEPFVKEQKYSFPVLIANTYMQSVLGNFGIPRNWIVTPEGNIERDEMGYDGSGDQFVERALERIESARSPGGKGRIAPVQH